MWLADAASSKAAGGLEKFARLDTTCTVIDAFTMFHDFETADLLSSRRDDVVPEDERTVSDLMVDQIEFADVIILNKVDMVSLTVTVVVFISDFWNRWTERRRLACLVS